MKVTTVEFVEQDDGTITMRAWAGDEPLATHISREWYSYAGACALLAQMLGARRAKARAEAAQDAQSEYDNADEPTPLPDFIPELGAGERP